MFLTTNRATTIDDAFKSRISVCIEYKSLDVDSRKKVWFNLLKAAEITLTETGDLAEDGAILALSQLSLNGREIKTAIRNAQCMALYEKTPVSFKHLMFAASLNSVSLS
jgi:SpoVK/Ycf46/Vps4 family AAA+-type ATPase